MRDYTLLMYTIHYLITGSVKTFKYACEGSTCVRGNAGTHRCSLLLRESAILWESGITCLTSNRIATRWEKCLEGKAQGLSVYTAGRRGFTWQRLRERQPSRSSSLMRWKVCVRSTFGNIIPGADTPRNLSVVPAKIPRFLWWDSRWGAIWNGNCWMGDFILDSSLGSAVRGLIRPLKKAHLLSPCR